MDRGRPGSLEAPHQLPSSSLHLYGGGHNFIFLSFIARHAASQESWTEALCVNLFEIGTSLTFWLELWMDIGYLPANASTIIILSNSQPVDSNEWFNFSHFHQYSTVLWTISRKKVQTLNVYNLLSCSVPHIQAQLDKIFTAGWKTETDFHFSVLSQWVLKPVVERMGTTIHLHSCSFIWPSSRPDCWPHARIKLFHYYCANALPSLMRNMQTGCFLKIHFFVRYRTKPTRAQLVRWRASAWMDSHYSVALLSFEWRRSRSCTVLNEFPFFLTWFYLQFQVF